METPATEASQAESKYQVKGTKNDSPADKVDSNEEEKKAQTNKNKDKKSENKKKGSPKKLITINSINLMDFSSYEEAAEAIHNALATYKNASADSIKGTLVNYMKKQCIAGLKEREALLKDAVKSSNILTQCVHECEELTGSKDKKPDQFDYCVHFIYKMIEALLKNQKAVLNRVTIENIRVYYELVSSIFNLDSVNRRRRADNKSKAKKAGEETKGESTEEKKQEAAGDKAEETKAEDAKAAVEEPEVSVWGDGPKLTDFKDLTDKHLQWILKILGSIKVVQTNALIFHISMSFGHDVKSQVITSVQDIFQDKASNQMYGCHLVEKYDLYNDIELLKTCEKLAEMNKLETILKLIGKYSKYPQDLRNGLQRQLIDNLLKSNFNKFGKICDEIVQKVGIPYEDYPMLVERKKRNSVMHFANNFLRKKEDDKEYMGLDRVESLFDGNKECIIYLCEIVYSTGKKQMAKGIFQRHKLQASDFSIIKTQTKDMAQMGKEIEQMKYDKSEDHEPAKDMFEPISMPSKDHIRFPLDIKIEFIDTEKKIAQLEDLKGQKYIGVDAEWRPAPHRWHESKGPAIFQIAGKTQAYIIDMIKLGKNPKLNSMLKTIFTHKNTSVVGFGFASDIAMFHKHCPAMKFIDFMPKHIDAHKVFSKVFPNSKKTGLATCCEEIMDKKLCKKEQMSNWEMRPLRYSQEHYAAMDAWVLVQIMEKLLDKAKKQKMDVSKFTERIGQDKQKKDDQDKKGSEQRQNENEKQKPVKRERNNQRNLVVPENQEANPDKIEEYQKHQEYHTKMVEHFNQLIQKAQVMKQAKEVQEKEDKQDEKAEVKKDDTMDEKKAEEPEAAK